MRCRDSVVSVATKYGLAGPGIEFLGPKKSPEQRLLGLFLEGKSARVNNTSTGVLISPNQTRKETSSETCQ